MVNVTITIQVKSNDDRAPEERYAAGAASVPKAKALANDIAKYYACKNSEFRTFDTNNMDAWQKLPVTNFEHGVQKYAASIKNPTRQRRYLNGVLKHVKTLQKNCDNMLGANMSSLGTFVN